MKFSNNGVITFGTEVESKGLFAKLFAKIKGDNAEELNGACRATINYEQSLEISTAELAELFDKTKEYDNHTLEIFGKLKKGFFNFEEELRKRAAIAVPEWQDIFHNCVVKDAVQRQELHDLEKDLSTKEEK